MKQFSKHLIPAAVTLGLAAPQLALATNGMNLEGYGPIAHSMGGASMAYDNGTAAVMNNPTTLSLMPTRNRLDVAVGFLGPDVTVSTQGMEAKSSADAFFMPALGWAQKTNKWTYGVGLFSQGGMGTEYDANSFMSAGSGKTTRSEVGVGRLIAPIVFDINKNFIIGGSVDFVWAGMDIQMALTGDQFDDLVDSDSQEYGTASGSLTDKFDNFGLPTNYAYMDFSNSSPFTGEAKATGLAGKLGGTWILNKQWSFGLAYHSKTNLSDLESDNAKFTANVDATGAGRSATQSIPLSGKITVKDFQWPATAAIGTAFTPSDNWKLVADLKYIMWKDVMKDFKMSFEVDQSSSNDYSAFFGPDADFRGDSVDIVFFQEWDDQLVIQLGGEYKATEKLDLRAGWNYGKNPIPDQYLHPLFPAIVENHLTAGVGYDIDNNSDVNFSLVYGFEKTATSGSGVTVSHSQLNWQFMYSYLW